MHFKYNLLIVFEIEEFNFALYCRNKYILRRPHHYCSSFSFFFKNQRIYYTQLECQPEPAKPFFSWGASKLEEKCSSLCYNMTGANRIFVGLDVCLPPPGKRFLGEGDPTLFGWVVGDMYELNTCVMPLLWWGMAKSNSEFREIIVLYIYLFTGFTVQYYGQYSPGHVFLEKW